jgi:hypothetical protein
MASQNNLLGSGKPFVVPLPEPTPVELQQFAPAWRFHKECPEGVLVKTDKQLAELDAAGWKDEPGKVRLLPGHEKVWEAEQALESVKTKSGKGSIIEPSGKPKNLFDAL